LRKGSKMGQGGGGRQKRTTTNDNLGDKGEQHFIKAIRGKKPT